MNAKQAESRPGKPRPLGACHDGKGVNFAVYSERATGIEVCIFDPSDPKLETLRVPLTEVTAHVWHGYVPNLPPGTLYGYRAHGPYEPDKGLLFNPNQLLMDPYAKAIFGKVDWKAPVTGAKPDERDDSSGKPRSVVVSDEFDWGDDRPLNTPLEKTVIYEVHVRGFTMRHPSVPAELRGTYAGFCHPAAIEHLKKLGMTAVELLPVHEYVSEGFLHDRGLQNYWGYNTLGYFAPEQRYCSRGGRGEQVVEFKEMVKQLHRAGIEVILDVVYNHSAEGNEVGPSLSFKGLANGDYYRLKPDEPRQYVDFTGCGNTLNAPHPQTLKLVMDSLRYWAQTMHVDGFRFDLATVLGREAPDYDRGAGFFRAIHQDPVLSKLKLIAEPWDLEPGGYQLGNFPILWSEWNGKYRDAIRRYWRGDENQIAELGYRLTGSADLFQLSGRRPQASINYVAVHDGFTLHDLVTYNEKHNEANGEENRDGASENYSWNCGTEGETDDPLIHSLREQQKRNFLATLFLSQGVPLLCAGDEMGRTQRGNNNAYCQDNELSWLNWEIDDAGRALLAFTAKVSRLRAEQPVLRRNMFFRGAHIWESTFKDLAWFRPDGKEMTQEDWQKPFVRSSGFLLGGDALNEVDESGRQVVGDTLLVLMNCHKEPVSFALPAAEWGIDWEAVLDTAHAEPVHARMPAGSTVEVASRSLMVLRHAAMKP